MPKTAEMINNVLAALALACAVPALARADAPAARPAAPTAQERRDQELRQLRADLAGADDAKAAAAVRRVGALAAGSRLNKAGPLWMLVDAKRYANADAVWPCG